MPTKPSVRRKIGHYEAMPSHGGSKLYDRRWDKTSKAERAKTPLCEACTVLGCVSPSEIVDHKTPHCGDVSLFWDACNWWCLCKEHHDRKTKIELTTSRSVMVMWRGMSAEELVRALALVKYV